MAKLMEDEYDEKHYKNMEEQYGIPDGFSSYCDSEVHEMMQFFGRVLHGIKPMREWDDEVVQEVCGWYYKDVLAKLLLRCVSADVAAEHGRILREAEEAEQKHEWKTVWNLKDDALRLLLDAATEPDEATLRSLAGLWLLRNIEIPWDSPHGHAHITCSAAELHGMLERYVLEDRRWHNELYPLVTANFDRFQEQLLTFADTLPGDVLAVVMDAGYMYFDDIETHYAVGDAFSEDELCLYGCNHMG